MAVEDTLKNVLVQVLDVKPDEINPQAKLSDAFGVDSTEMVEISVGLKKALKLEIGDNELKKTNTFNEIVEALKKKGAL